MLLASNPFPDNTMQKLPKALGSSRLILGHTPVLILSQHMSLGVLGLIGILLHHVGPSLSPLIKQRWLPRPLVPQRLSNWVVSVSSTLLHLRSLVSAHPPLVEASAHTNEAEESVSAAIDLRVTEGA